LTDNSSSAPTSDAARLTALLRHHRLPLCTSCAAAKLGMELPRVLEATDAVTKTVALDQVLGACSMCGRSQWVLSLRV